MPVKRGFVRGGDYRGDGGMSLGTTPAEWLAIIIVVAGIVLCLFGCDSHHDSSHALPTVQKETGPPFLCHQYPGIQPPRPPKVYVPGKSPRVPDSVCFVDGECFYDCPPTPECER